ncbi:Mis12-Mtw1 protein family-domain-containing protein [Colletotrichum navitas]|uniref:Mis12-Mtw1 protein family-domain-containing protein n=1 Tax=Colletotrichum navitas TaxID=681940 RepID=A0AAD8Q022_9PEZI|nr:Mis12-Mtw1 protein family-domain-containing protein [Colletotrichum navitas]KAK1593188.1 Mis12-Mtw1 protein family-domain-containing protein [Colletotrichum navitas]
MTTVIRTRHPLQVISMSNEQPGSRKSKRLAATSVYDEQDGDFHFTRGSKSKRVKSAESEPEPETGPEPDPAPIVAKKSGRGRPAKARASAAAKAPEPTPSVTAPKAATSSRPRTRRTASLQPAEEDELEFVAPKRTTRRSTRNSTGKADKPEKERPLNRPPPVPEEDHDAATATPMEVERQRTPRVMDEPVESEKITLPVSDTPVINRNKEMRKKGGGNRRSSTGMRGRRASSLIESGHNAIPHREVETAEFYKHIESEGLMEPRRMKQLLTWCGERALLEKPPHGQTDSNTILGARYIQEQLLKDFSTKSEFSDWFSREEGPKKPVIYKPNPRNIEHQQKIEQLEQKVKRLKEEKKKWLALKRLRTEVSPLFPEAGAAQTAMADASVLDPNEAEMLSWLTNPASSFENVRAKTLSRLRNTQSTLEFKVDQLADGIHKLLQRVDTAGREADKVLSLSAARLKEREVREKANAGTKEMPVMEVLRSLGRILPEGAE